MKLELLNESQARLASEYFENFPIKGLVNFKLDRLGDFFRPYRLISPVSETYSLRDTADMKLKGLASFLVQNVQLEGETVPIAWARDLRVSSDRAAIMNWAYHFVPVLERVIQKHNLKAVFSIINLQDIGTLNAFLRPRPLKRRLPRYFLYRKFNLVTLHGHFPWANRPLETIRIVRGAPANVEALMDYIFAKNKFRPFSEVHNAETFFKKCQRLGISEKDFFIAQDKKGQVVGCLAPWSTEGLEHWVPLSYSLRAHNFRQFLKFFWLLGYTRRLSKPVRSTGYESPLKFKRLSFVFSENEDIFETLLWSAFENADPDEFLVYTHANADTKLRPPLGWVCASLPHALYTVVPPGEPIPDFLNPAEVRNPEIESQLL